LIDYNESDATQASGDAGRMCLYLDRSVSWVDVQGLGSEDILQRLGQVFKLHLLILEDLVNVPNVRKWKTMKTSW